MANEHNKLTGIPTLAYEGVEAQSPLNCVYHERNPRPSDKKNYRLGCLWVNRANNTVWMLVSLERNTAIWLQFDTGIGDLLQVQTSTGISVPDATRTLYLPNGTLIATRSPGMNSVTFNITNGGDGQIIIGQGALDPVWGNLTSAGLTVVITPNLMGPGTINLDVGAPILPTNFQTDGGIAIPIGDVLNVIGGAGITTTGAGNTITVALTVPVPPTTFTTDAGDAIPAADVLNVVGDDYITTAGAGNTVTVTLTNTPQGRSINDCSFLAYLNATIPLIAGDVVQRPLPANTELFDTGNDYNPGTYTFTAPRGGYYYFIFGILYSGIPGYVPPNVPQTYFTPSLNGVANIFFINRWAPFQNLVVNPAYGNSVSNWGSHICSMAAGDTMQINYAFIVNAGPPFIPVRPPNSNVYGSALPNIYTYFGGYQIY